MFLLLYGVGAFSRITGRFQQREEKVVNRSIADQLEVEEMLQTFETDGSEGRQSEEQFRETTRLFRIRRLAVFFEHSVHLVAKRFHLRRRLESYRLCFRK